MSRPRDSSTSFLFIFYFYNLLNLDIVLFPQDCLHGMSLTEFEVLFDLINANCHENKGSCPNWGIGLSFLSLLFIVLRSHKLCRYV